MQTLPCRQRKRWKHHKRVLYDGGEEVEYVAGWEIKALGQDDQRKPDKDDSNDGLSLPRCCVSVCHGRLLKHFFLRATNVSNEGGRNRQSRDDFFGEILRVP